MNEPFKPINVVISGASGFFGSALIPVLEREGCIVYRLVRRTAKEANEIEWHPEKGELNHELLPEAPVCINLSGENVAEGRWTKAKKGRILNSRVDSTRTFVEAVKKLEAPVKHFISASGVGFYGDRDEETLTEKSELGTGFLAEVCRAWEAEARALEESNIKVTLLRFGLIVGKDGGALEKMLLPFKLGLGGPIGSGKQWLSWISMIDAVYAIGHIISNDITGPINMTAPVPVRNKEFTKTLASTLTRPAFLAMPSFAAHYLSVFFWFPFCP
jgi:hypothetical protein